MYGRHTPLDHLAIRGLALLIGYAPPDRAWTAAWSDADDRRSSVAFRDRAADERVSHDGDH
jgi:hypothetical protein